MTDFMYDDLKRKNWFCKSDINKNLLKSMGLSFLSVKDAKEMFDELCYDGRFVKPFMTGMADSQRFQRHTKFVYKFYFYKYVVKGI